MASGLKRGLISIHALREEGDQSHNVAAFLFADFYPRPPRGGRRDELATDAAGKAVFLSTPSARRATALHSISLSVPSYFYPRPPRGGRREKCYYHQDRQKISIHALREEGDFIAVVVKYKAMKISIHALREEGDLFLFVPLLYYQ